MKKLFIAIILSCITSPGFATIELNDNLSLSGFGSTSWTKSDNATPLLVNRLIDDNSCYDCDTLFGVQLDFFYDAFKASAQVLKRPQDDWSEPQLEWAYLAYNYDDFEFRGGRLRMPLFLASEYYYVGHAFTSARPPSEVYNSILGITAYNGLSLLWNYNINDDMTLTTSPFVGFRDESKVDFDANTDFTFTINEVHGVNLTLNGDSYRWNATYLYINFDQQTRLTNLTVNIPGSGPVFIANQTSKIKDQTIRLYSLGAEYEFDALTLALEGQTNNVNNIASSWYVSASYNLDKLTPYVTYGQRYNISDNKAGRSYLAGLRYDLHYNVSLNAEWQHYKTYPNATGAFISSPADRSANLYTVMLNFVF